MKQLSNLHTTYMALWNLMDPNNSLPPDIGTKYWVLKLAKSLGSSDIALTKPKKAWKGKQSNQWFGSIKNQQIC